MVEENNTPVGEAIQPETTVETEQAPAPEVATTPTVSDAFGEKPKVDSVPLARLNKEISRKKELEAEVARLQSELAAGKSSKGEVAADIRALAEEHNVDVGFLDKLVSTVKAQTERELEDKLRPITEREAMERREKAFEQHFTQALNNMPEYQGIVNANVIKQMAFNPANASKTFAALIEEAYGSSVKGRGTMETVTSRGGGKPETLDLARARTDTSYFKEVMADPELKKQYNSSLTDRVQL